MSKTGRPASIVHDDQGKIVEGLRVSNSKRKVNGNLVLKTRYYFDFVDKGKRDRKWFGSDKGLAILRCREWLADQDAPAFRWHEPIKGTRIKFPNATEAKAIQDRLDRSGKYKTIRWEFEPDLDFPRIRRFILSDPQAAANKLQIPELARLTSLPPVPESIPLAKCPELYHGKRVRITTEESKKVIAAWKLFQDVVETQTLAEITDEHLAKWFDVVFDPYDNGDGSAKTLHHKVDRVARLLRYVRDKKQQDVPNCDRILRLIKASELPPISQAKPSPIKIEDYHALLAGAKDTLWEPIFLLSLNACYYPCDIRRVTIHDIDLTTSTLYFERKKKHTPRVAVLWKRTVEALRKWTSANKPREHLFFHGFNDNQHQYSGQGLRNAFRRFRDSLGVGPTIGMEHIRDGAYTAAVNHPGVNEKTAKILAGHKLSGDTDAYAARDTRAVEFACKAIEDYYFGGET